MTAAGTALVVISGVLLVMLAEAWLSRSNERALRRQGAIEPPGDVYHTMQWSYPVSFVAMGVEGALRGEPTQWLIAIGLAVLLLAKALKYWAIATLGPRWTFRVLVPPGAPLVHGGPYAVMRHPNYVGVLGELVGVGVLVDAPITCAVSVAGFGALLWRRIQVEERALGR